MIQTAHAERSTLPIYNQDKPEKTGLYLGLFHGRNSLDEDMDDWGFNGPIIGPLNFVHTTYQSTIKLEFVHQADRKKYELNPDFTVLELEQGMVKFSNVWYGDWTVFYHHDKPVTDTPRTVINEYQKSITH